MQKTQASAREAAYTGVDNLEKMRLAENYNSFLIELIVRNSERNERLLDFGAGLGLYAELLRPHSRLVTCFEIDRNLATSLRDRGFAVLTDSSELRDPFDMVYSFNVLEHIEDDEESLRLLFRCLRPGGKLLLFVPAFTHLFSSMDEKVGHLRRYRRGDLRQKVERAGFVVRASRYVDSVGYFAALAYKFFGNDRGDLSPTGLRLFDRYFFPLSLKLDLLCGWIFGKNVLLVAEKPAAQKN